MVRFQRLEEVDRKRKPFVHSQEIFVFVKRDGGRFRAAASDKAHRERQ